MPSTSHQPASDRPCLWGGVALPFFAMYSPPPLPRRLYPLAHGSTRAPPLEERGGAPAQSGPAPAESGEREPTRILRGDPGNGSRRGSCGAIRGTGVDADPAGRSGER
eukprot:gene15507-biopygen5417